MHEELMNEKVLKESVHEPIGIQYWGQIKSYW